MAEALTKVGDTFGNEVDVCRRLREMASQYNIKRKEAARNQSDPRSLKDKLATDFAILKALHVGRGRDGNWGPFITELGLAVRTVDRWVADKLASAQLPEWVVQRLTVDKPESAASPDSDPNPDLQESDHVAKPIIRFTGKALPNGTEILKFIIPFTADEKAQFVECLNLIGEVEAKRLFVEALVRAAESMRGRTLFPLAQDYLTQADDAEQVERRHETE